MRATTKSPRVALYARVSTLDQDPEAQLRELRTYCERRGWTSPASFVDHGVSGAKERRPALDRLLTEARRRKVDVVLVWSLDRFGRSLRHLVTTIEELTGLGVGFVVLTQGIDTTHANPASTLTIQVLGAVAEFERALIRQRVVAGVAKAKAQGKRIGRPPALLDLAEARRLLAAGVTLRGAARALGTNHPTLRRALARAAGGTEPRPEAASA